MNTDPTNTPLAARVAALEENLRRLQRRLEQVERSHGVAMAPAVEVSEALAPPQVPATAAEPLSPPPVAAGPKPAPAVQPPPLPRSEPVHEPAPEPVAPRPSRLRAGLSALHLLPPSGASSGEVQLGAWWATRIGALLAVIGAVFFGVYVSVGTPPIVKLAELAGVAVAVTVAGRWLDRRTPRVGAVVFGAGLALIAFTAFAAYAVPAVKVVDNIAVAALLQAAAVGLVYVAAVRRNSPTTACMATLFGYASAFFSITASFDDFAIVGSLTLAAMTVIFRRWRGWGAPLAVAAVLAHALFLSVALAIWRLAPGERGPVFVYGVLAAGFGLIVASLFLESPGGDGRVSRVQRWAQSLNVSSAVLAGLIATVVLWPRKEISGFFFVSGAVLAGLAVAAWRRAPADSIFTLFAVKGAALLALGAATEWGARTRWLSLLIESFVLLAAARRTRRPVLIGAAGMAWAISLGFFWDDVPHLRGVWSISAGAAVMLFVVASPTLMAWLAREARDRRPSFGRELETLTGGASLLPALWAGVIAFQEGWAPLVLLAGALATGAVARMLRSKVPLGASALLFALAHAAVQAFDRETNGLGWWWAGAGAVGTTSVLLGCWVAVRWNEDGGAGAATGRSLPAAMLLAAGAAAWFTVAMATLPLRSALALAALIAAGASVFGQWRQRAEWLGGGVLALAAAVVLYVRHHFDPGLNPGAAGWLWLGLGGAMAVLRAHGGEAGARLQDEGWWVLANLLAVAANVALAALAATAQFGVTGAAASLLAVAGVHFAIGWRHGLRAGFAAAWWVLLFAMADLVVSRWLPALHPWTGLAVAFVVGCAAAAVPVAGARGTAWLQPGRAWRVSSAVLAAAFLVHLALRGPAPWDSLGSVLMALGGIALFALGLFFRSRVHRVTGLVVLALCVPRVFLVDISSTLHRIAAFAVLGGVLLWVGFSYQRFRHLIEGGGRNERPDESEVQS